MNALRSFGGGTVFGRRFGEGPPRFLALHGWARSAADFSETLDGLDAIALDLPGFGASPPPLSVSGARGYAGLIAEVLEEFPKPPVVVGHSFGGRVAVSLAASGATAGLLLTGVPLVRTSKQAQPAIGFRLLRRAHRLGLVSDDRMQSIRNRSGSIDYRNSQGVMREVLISVVNESYEEQLDVLPVPVHLLWGAQDTEVPIAVAEEAASRLRSRGAPVRLEVVEGADHMLPLRRPELVRERLVGWDSAW